MDVDNLRLDSLFNIKIKPLLGEMIDIDCDGGACTGAADYIAKIVSVGGLQALIAGARKPRIILL